MKAINLNLNSIKDFSAKFVKNLSWMFFAAFLILLVFEGFEIKGSLDVALNTNQVPLPPSTEKQVRINFSAYETALQRIQSTQNFAPSGGISQDPFSVPPPTGP
jgi:hypothetical protein